MSQRVIVVTLLVDYDPTVFSETDLKELAEDLQREAECTVDRNRGSVYVEDCRAEVLADTHVRPCADRLNSKHCPVCCEGSPSPCARCLQARLEST